MISRTKTPPRNRGAGLSAAKTGCLTRGNPLFAGVILILVVLILYWPSYRAGFIWDDETMMANALVKGGWHGLWDIWFSAKFIDYLPLTSTTFWIEWQLWGVHQTTQHASNVVLHALNVVLLWQVLRRLRIPGAWVAALIFAVHPVCVASVTWVAERKNTLSMFFYLLSLLFYLRFAQKESSRLPGNDSQIGMENRTRHLESGKGCYWFSLIAFFAGLCCKPSIVVLPAVLLLCAWWLRGRISRRDAACAAPFFIAALVFGAITMWVQYHPEPGRTFALGEDNFLMRTVGAGQAVWFYLSKDLLPTSLTMHYPRWQFDPVAIVSYLPEGLVLGLFFVFWTFRHSWGRACLFGFGYFVLALLPGLGLINMRFLAFSQVADHLQYLALPGIIAFLVGCLSFALSAASNKLPGSNIKRMASAPYSLSALVIVVVLFFFALNWQYQCVVANPEALWRDNIRKNPASWPARYNLGIVLSQQGKFKEAQEQCAAALAIRPDFAEAWSVMGNALIAQGNYNEALHALGEAIRLTPGDSKSHNNLGVLFRQTGRTDEAAAEFSEACRLDPKNTEAPYNLGYLLAQRYQTNDIPQVEQVIARLTDALQVNPGKLPQDIFVTEVQLGVLSFKRQRAAEGVRYWKEALKRMPDSAPLLNNLAWVLATHPDPAVRDGSEAVRLAERACALATGEPSAYFDTLAASCAEAGCFDDAVRTQEKAVSLVEASADAGKAARLQRRLQIYRSRQPYHETK